MRVVLKHDLNHVKNGYAARSPELRLTASGATPEIARRNLEGLALSFLRSFERAGCLPEEIAAAKLESYPDGDALMVALAD